MGFRFQKRINLGGGFRLNLSKSGVGISAGVRGLRVGVGPRGVRKTASIPGTGISWVSERRLGGRRPRASAGDGGSLIGWLLLLGLGLWVLSVLWVYLIAAGLLVIAGAAAWLVARHLRARDLAPHLEAARGAPRAALPEGTYQPVIEVDPAVFDDPIRAEAAALGAFKAWARRLPSAPTDPSDSAVSLEMRTRHVGRLVTDCVGKHAVWRSRPYGGRKAVTAPPVRPDSIDPWTADPAELDKSSRHYASCDDCRGEGKVSCRLCDGAARIGCTDCGGAGKVVGTTAAGHERVLNCKSCRGRGHIKCAECTRGRIRCERCHGKKKLERWLEIEERAATDIQVEPDGAVTRAFSWGVDGAPATRAEIEADARVVAELAADGALAPADVAAIVPPGWMAASWGAIQPQLAERQRVRRQSFALLEIPSIEVTYSLDGEIAQTIDFEGRRLLAPPLETERLFLSRAIALRRLRWGLAAAPAAVAGVYLLRGAYFASGATAGMVGALILACAGIYGLVWNATLGRRRARGWLPLALAPLIPAAALALVAEPDVDTAAAHIAAGELEAAERELEALGGAGEPELEAAYARLRLERALGESDWRDAASIAAEIPAKSAERQRARAHVSALVTGAIERALAAGETDRAHQILEAGRDHLGDVEARALDARIVAQRGARCAEADDFRCALDAAESLESLGAGAEGQALRERSLAAVRARAEAALEGAAGAKERKTRVARIEAADALWVLLLSETGEAPPAALARARQRLARDRQVLAREEARRQAAEERARQREEQRRLREQRRQQRIERRQRRLSAPLRCCDGTDSPSCTCGGPRRGCCSRHGGVCGCSE